MSRYIDAEYLMKRYKATCDIVCQYTKKQRYTMCISCGIGSAIEVLEDFPTADVAEVRHGRWIEKPFEFRCGGITTYSSVTDTVCSVCGESAIEYAESPYCPWCGAKMDEENEDEL